MIALKDKEGHTICNLDESLFPLELTLKHSTTTRSFYIKLTYEYDAVRKKKDKTKIRSMFMNSTP